MGSARLLTHRVPPLQADAWAGFGWDLGDRPCRATYRATVALSLPTGRTPQMSYEGLTAETVAFRGHNDDQGEAYHARPTRPGKH